jgi:hypothetical protein
MKDLDAIMADGNGEAVPEPHSDFHAEPAADQDFAASPDDPGEARQGTVPHQALHAERQKARKLEEENVELRHRLFQEASMQQRVPELWDDPDLYLEHRMAPLAGQIGEMKEFVSETLAVQTHGENAVEAAKRSAEDLARSGAPEFQALWTRLNRSRHPMDELVRWDREQSALKKYGADPEAYIAAEIERRLYEGASPHSAHPPAARQQLPSSFAAARSSGPRAGGAGPRSLSEIMKR